MVLRRSAKKNKRRPSSRLPFFIQMRCLWSGATLCGSMHKSQQSLLGCTCVKHRVLGGLHAVSHRSPPPSPRPVKPAGHAARIDHYIPGGWWQEPRRPSAPRPPRCWHRRAQSRWLQPAAVSSESKQPCTFLTSSKVSQLTNCSALRGESLSLMTRAIGRILGALRRSDLIFSCMQRDASW